MVMLASMPGRPILKARKATVRTSDGSVIAFPHLSRLRAGLSHAEWRSLSPSEKLERMFSMSLDDLYAIMSWPIGELDPFRLSVRMQVTRVVFMVGVKAMLDGKLSRDAARERDRERVLGERIRGFEQSQEQKLLQERGE